MNTTKEEILLFKALKKEAINKIRRGYPFLRNYIINISDIDSNQDNFTNMYFYKFIIKVTPFSDAKNAFQKVIEVDFDLFTSKYFTKQEVFIRVLNVELDEIRKQIGEK